MANIDIIPTPEVQMLFTQYEELSQASDFKGIARLFGNKVMTVGPNGTEFHHNNIITRWRFDKSMKSFYGEAGLASMRVRHIVEDFINHQYSLVKTSWVVRFSKNNDQSLVFNISYLVRKKRRRAEIIVLIAHEDEKKILEGYGIIK